MGGCTRGISRLTVVLSVRKMSSLRKVEEGCRRSLSTVSATTFFESFFFFLKLVLEWRFYYLESLLPAAPSEVP